ncbi:MAG: putative bifunctional diguanylate cyclase/phosphodiesterase [Planctomycetota bacterium]|jgi:diguanylate cyclase (GGDEF)-like protein
MNETPHDRPGDRPPRSSTAIGPDLASARILIVDDEPAVGQVVRRHLHDAGYRQVSLVVEAREALDRIRGEEPDVVLLDVCMPGVDGLTILEALRAEAATAYLPVLVLTAAADDEMRQEALDLGATDFLAKPIDARELLPRLRNALVIKAHHDHLARYAEMLEERVRAQTEVLRRTNERLRSVNADLQYEVGERRRLEDRFRHEALHDALTDLPNRALLKDRIEQCIKRTKRQTDYRFALLFIDIDNFKPVNDTHGHRTGDELLVAVARRLKGCLRALDTSARPTDDTTARLGGDEFVVLLDGVGDAESVARVSDRLLEAFREPFAIGGADLRAEISVGTATSDGRYDDAEDMLRDADTALYVAKEQGKGRCVVFDERMRQNALERQLLEEDLRAAVEAREMFVQYQPIVCLVTGVVKGFEALVRWRHVHRGLIPAGDFMPLAEAMGLAPIIGRRVRSEACGQVRRWQRAFPMYADLFLSVNVSGSEFVSPDLVDGLLATAREAHFPPERLNVDVSEAVILEDLERAAYIVNTCRAAGLGVHVHDFGACQWALQYVNRLPLTGVKLDRSFIAGLCADRANAATVQAVETVVHSRKMVLIAEGIETIEQLAELQALECDLGQGYFLARALEPERAEALLVAPVNWLRAA